MASTGEHSNRIHITNLRDRDSLYRLLFLHHRSSQNPENEENAILEYFKVRTHQVAASKDGVNNSKEAEEICVICHTEFKHEETIGTLGCGHEYHTSCIKQWLLRKKNCPMCRASVLPFTSTKTTI
ncbi:hypothetical protein HAX54_044541 [Datura stramonium]|uniref:RING-type E3 ubiquitin transferase n=1 Tax=Datura stramonium TaxID=4076 RepID=A0ABS8RP54_DATST|nr:hypothetical protein [Datura stramonium]